MKRISDQIDGNFVHVIFLHIYLVLYIALLRSSLNSFVPKGSELSLDMLTQIEGVAVIGVLRKKVLLRVAASFLIAAI